MDIEEMTPKTTTLDAMRSKVTSIPKGVIAIVMVAAASLMACPEEEVPCSPTAEVGSCCNEDKDCSPHICLTELPGGYCTRPCDSDVPCPDDAQCVDVLFSGKSGYVEGKYCLQECGGGLPDCRSDHACAPMEGSEGTVCFPG